MKRRNQVKLSQEEGEALIERIEANNLVESEGVFLVKLIRLYFWLTFALQETKISLKRLKRALFGKGLRKGDPRGQGGGGAKGEGGSFFRNCLDTVRIERNM